MSDGQIIFIVQEVLHPIRYTYTVGVFTCYEVALDRATEIVREFESIDWEEDQDTDAVSVRIIAVEVDKLPCREYVVFEKTSKRPNSPLPEVSLYVWSWSDLKLALTHSHQAPSIHCDGPTQV